MVFILLIFSAILILIGMNILDDASDREYAKIFSPFQNSLYKFTGFFMVILGLGLMVQIAFSINY